MLDQIAGRYTGEARPGPELKGDEGYRLSVKTGPGAPAVLVVGNDARGVLFGVGRLLRELRLEQGRIATRGKTGHRHRAKVSAARAPAGLPPQEQLLRRLGPADVGAVLPRPGRLRLQRHRVDPAALGRRCGQPAFPSAADGDDAGHVPRRRFLWPGCVDLVSGDGQGLFRPEDRRVRAARMGRSLREVAAASTRCSCPVAIPATRSRAC